MLIGGYKIIDLKDVALSGEKATIPGIYAALEANYRKPIYLKGLNIGSTEYFDCFPQCSVVGSDFKIIAYGYTITINDDDEVTAVAIAKELPTVTAADNGKVLTVVSGAWAAAAFPT